MKIGFGTFFGKAVLFGIISAVINAILFFVGNLLNGSAMQIVRPGQSAAEPLSIVMVLIMSIVPVLIAAILYFLLQGTGRPSLIFLIIAIIVFILFFFSAQSAAQGSLTNWVLQIMHLITGICSIEAIARSIRSFRPAITAK